MLARSIIVPVFAVLAAARAITENPLAALAARACSNADSTSYCARLGAPPVGLPPEQLLPADKPYRAGDRRRGIASAARVWPDSHSVHSSATPNMASIEHCLFCFETLDAELSNRTALSLDDVFASYAAYAAYAAGTTPPPSQTQPGPSPLFVTWNTDRGASEPGEYILRGCIGTFEAQPLAHGIATYALTAALHDTRFRPIAQRELPHLEVAVTLLTDFEPAADAMDWQLGKHGLRISFASASGRQHYGATYLPDVAPEQGWTKEETVASLMRKAGWSPRRTSAGGGDAERAPWTQVASFETVRYQGAKQSVSYATYKAWRDWADTKK